MLLCENALENGSIFALGRDGKKWYKEAFGSRRISILDEV
jgi:hypothetical protein